VLNVGDEIFAGDFKGRILSNTGDGSMMGKAAIKIPYLADTEIEATFTNVAFNECYELQAGAQNKIISVYDPAKRGILDVDEAAEQFSNLVRDLIDLLKNYTGKASEKAAIDTYINKIKETANDPSLIPETKATLDSTINFVTITWAEVKACPNPTTNLRTTEATTADICKLKDLQDATSNLSNISLKPTNSTPPDLNIPFRCNTDILGYWKNVLNLKTTLPQQFPDAEGYNWNHTQYTLYDSNWKNNNKWWHIREVCLGSNCENTQTYVFNPQKQDYVLLYDKAVDCDGNMQALVNLSDHLGLTYAIIFGLLAGPEDLAFEFGVPVVKYIGTSLNVAQKAAKAKNFAKVVATYVKDSKLAKNIGDWWKTVLDKSYVGEDYLRKVWLEVEDRARGLAFESYRYANKYGKEGYEHVGQLDNGYFELIDFWKNGHGISFKSTNATTKVALKNIEDNIISIGQRLGKEVGRSKNKRFLGTGTVEIAIPKGNLSRYPQLWSYLEQLGVDNKVVIKILEL
jgi:hypothetical protein